MSALLAGRESVLSTACCDYTKSAFNLFNILLTFDFATAIPVSTRKLMTPIKLAESTSDRITCQFNSDSKSPNMHQI